MCQLTLICTDSAYLTNELAFATSFLNSELHKDGWGVFNRGQSFKSKFSPHNFPTILSALGPFKKNKTLCVHCRRASKNITTALETTHPFELSNIIGCHNGTLWWEDESPQDNLESRDSDSLRFLTELNQNMDTESDFSSAFEKTMADVTGKFAFIIWDKKAKLYRVIRGESASLYYTVLTSGEERIGIMVNTECHSLKEIIRFTKARIAFSAKEVRTIEFSEPNELEKETSYILDETGYGLDKSGIVKENNRKVTYQAYTSNMFQHLPVENKVERVFADAYKEVTSFMTEYNYSPIDLDIIFRAIFGKSIFESSFEEFSLFVFNLLGYFKPSNNIRRVLEDNIRLKYLEVVENLAIYEQFQLQFPMCLMYPKQLKILARKLFGKGV